MYKAVVTDLDGTLLDKDHLLSEYTKNTLKRFLNAGYKLYIATGRVERGAKLVSSQLDYPLDLITINGTRIIDSNSTEIFSILLDDKCTEILTNIDYKQFGEEIFINGYSSTRWLVTSDEYYKFYSVKRKDKIFPPEIISTEEFKNIKYNKIFFIGEFENLLKLREYLKDKISKYANIAFVSEKSLEIYNISANKKTAAMKLLERDNIKKEEVLCFGDGLNDYEMLSYFPNSYIMGNALKELKEKLPDVEMIEDSNTDSVARKIEEVFNI